MSEHEHPSPGEECPTCGRTMPKEKSDAERGPRRQRVSFSVPYGEEGIVEELEIAVVERHAEAWPADAAAARDGVGLEVVGSSNWRYRVHHFALYAVLNVPGLEPSE